MTAEAQIEATYKAWNSEIEEKAGEKVKKLTDVLVFANTTQNLDVTLRHLASAFFRLGMLIEHKQGGPFNLDEWKSMTAAKDDGLNGQLFEAIGEFLCEVQEKTTVSSNMAQSYILSKFAEVNAKMAIRFNEL